MGLYEQHYLKHYGVKGMKWGIRRYQNEDGTLTALGKERYYSESEQRSTYEHAKNSLVKNGYDSLKIIGDRDLEDAGAFLKKQSQVVHEKRAVYEESAASDYDDIHENREFVSAVKKRLTEELLSPDNVDDDDLIDLVAWDAIDDIMMSGKFESQKTKQAKKELNESIDRYRDNLKAVADSIVGKYGDQPVSYVEKGFLSKKKTTSTYKEVIDNTLYDLGGGLTMRHLLKGDIAIDNGEWIYDIIDPIVSEWKNSK